MKTLLQVECFAWLAALTAPPCLALPGAWFGFLVLAGIALGMGVEALDPDRIDWGGRT